MESCLRDRRPSNHRHISFCSRECQCRYGQSDSAKLDGPYSVQRFVLQVFIIGISGACNRTKTLYRTCLEPCTKRKPGSASTHGLGRVSPSRTDGNSTGDWHWHLVTGWSNDGCGIFVSMESRHGTRHHI